MLTQTSYKHIRLDENHTPVITGTTMKVIELALEHITHGWSPEELKFQHPFLDLGQIFSALAYYYDHKEEMDLDMENRLYRVDFIRAKTMQTTLRQKLHTKGLL